MAVTTLPRTRARRAPMMVTTLPPLVLVVTVLPLALDLLGNVQSAVSLGGAALAAAGLAALALAVVWVRYPRTSWLAAAVFAATASLAMRLAGADVAPILSLLAVLAVGIGGGFASRTHDFEQLLEDSAERGASVAAS